MKKQIWIFLLLMMILIGAVAVSIFIGPVSDAGLEILKDIRLPRVILGALVGMALAGAGAVLQGILRNPLADPYILGTSSGAAMGALAAFEIQSAFSLGIFFSSMSFYGLIFTGAFLATAASYGMARCQKQVPVLNLILSGVIVSTLCSAIVLLYFTVVHRNSFSMFFFLMGSLTEGRWGLILISGGIILLSLAAAALLANRLNVLSLGEEKASHLGIDVEKLKLLLFVLVSLMVSAAVAISGPIGFVGLIVPHVMRFLTGSDHKMLIPSSAAAGGILLVLADDIARTAAAPVEIPVGVIMTIFGAPFFLLLLRRKRKTQYF